MIAVEDGDELAIGVLHRVVQIACPGSLVVRARDVSDSRFGGEGAERRTPTVVQEVDAQLARRPVDGLGGQHRRPPEDVTESLLFLPISPSPRPPLERAASRAAC